MESDESPRSAARLGRRPSTSAVDLERAAFELFERKGFDATTVEEIAAAVGVSKRTFFRYFESKNDVVWGNFDGQLDVMRRHFRECPPTMPAMDAIRTVVVEFNRYDPAEMRWHRRRMELIFGIPALQAHAALRYRDWRNVVAEFIAERLEVAASELIPRSVAHAALGVAIASYEYWLTHPDDALTEVLDRAYRELAAGFGPR